MGVSIRHALLAASFCFIALIGTARATVFSPESFTLKNGLQVVVITNHRVPVVTHTIYYRVGAMDEPPAKSGLAHFLEHLMFKGTKNLKPGEFSAIVARNGGQENAFTSEDYTGYYQTVAVDRLEKMMQIEADRMTNLVLTSAGDRARAEGRARRMAQPDRKQPERQAARIRERRAVHEPPLSHSDDRLGT